MPNDENMDVENIDEELIENESSQEEQDGQEERQLTQEDIDNAVKSRVGRVERKAKRQLAEKDREIERYKQLESTIRAGLGASDDEDILEKVNSFYKEQGVDIPKYESKFYNRVLEDVILRLSEILRFAQYDKLFYIFNFSTISTTSLWTSSIDLVESTTLTLSGSDFAISR